MGGFSVIKLQHDTVTLVVGGSGSLGRVVVETLAQSHKKLIFTFCNNEKDSFDLESRLDCRKIRLDL